MGNFDIPPNPTSAGKLRIQLQLDKEELQRVVEFLRAADQGIQSRNVVGPIRQQSEPLPVLDPQGVSQARVAASEYGDAHRTPKEQEKLREARQLPRNVEQGLDNLAISGAPSSGSQAQAPSPQSGGLVSKRPETNNVPAQLDRHCRQVDSGDTHFSRWELSWKSDPSDHNGTAVQSMAYCAEIPGLPAMEEGSGWLVSASHKLLNLWGANCRGGVGGEPCLQLLHSQEVAYDGVDLAAAPSLSTMFVAMVDASGHNSCVSMHSLSPESMLAPKGHYSIPPIGSPLATGFVSAHNVVSLYKLGGPLHKGFAVAYGNRIAIWGNAKGGQSQDVPLVDFLAHGHPLSILSLSSSKPVLFSGSDGGEVALWSLQGPPSKPLQILKHHKKLVSGIEQVEQHLIVSSSLDGKMMIWDLRSADHPLKIIVPDGMGIYKLSVSPIGDCVILSTPQNLYAVNLLDLNAKLLPLLKQTPSDPYLNVTWNRQTLEVYATSNDGSISAFRNNM